MSFRASPSPNGWTPARRSCLPTWVR
jgi:hypothetical protein